MTQKIIPVAVSGGAGTRLWPLSTEARPKQFHALGSERTLLQDTVRRLVSTAGVEFAAPILVCNSRHAEMAQSQMAAVGRSPSRMILEPFGRNTAAVAMAASLVAQELDPEALVLLMPADHAITHPELFREAIIEAAPTAREQFVLFGVVPSHPETGYGYIGAGDPLDGRLSTVARFVEKPDLETAKSFLASGRYLWNAGIFLFSPQLLIEEMRRLAPGVADAVGAAMDSALRHGASIELDRDAFGACPSVSLDYAVMEHTHKATMIPLDAGWADIGAWNSIWEQGPRDSRGNVVSGDVEMIDAEGCVIWSEGKVIGAIGVSDLVIVQTEEGIVVLHKSRAQDIKLLVERLKRRLTGAS